MLKKIIALILAVTVCGSLCACGNEPADAPKDQAQTQAATEATTQPQEPEQTPEEIAAIFVKAMYYGDLDAFFALIPEFTYDALIETGEITVAEGQSKADAAYAYFADIMASEPEDLAADVQVETKISETMDKNYYLENVKPIYVSEGVVSEEAFADLEDVVFVAFNCDVIYENGEEFSLTDFNSAIPCVKIQGKWYVDMLYLLIAHVTVDTEISHDSVPIE